jgi:hypothetical protein
MTKSPFDFSEMMKAFDPAEMSKMFDPTKFMEAFELPRTDAFDMAPVMEANKRNFEAMVAANKAAAESYKEMLDKQMAIFQQVTQPAQEMLAKAADAQTMQSGTEAFSKAVEDGLALMQTLADATRKANEDAFSAVQSQVESAMKKK